MRKRGIMAAVQDAKCEGMSCVVMEDKAAVCSSMQCNKSRPTYLSVASLSPAGCRPLPNIRILILSLANTDLEVVAFLHGQ